MKTLLVVFTAVEKEDETDMDLVVENAINEIKDVFDKGRGESCSHIPICTFKFLFKLS